MPILRMKDGVKIRVADGADYDAIAKKYFADKQEQLRPKIEAQQAADREEYDPTKGMGTLEKLAVGNTSGWARAGRGVANMLGLASDEDTAAANQLDEPLLKTGAGKVGNFVGNTAALTAATAPVGAAGSAIRGGGVLARTLAAGAGNATAQGILSGAINADPGERGEGAVVGGLVGAGTYGLLKGAGRLASGLVKLDPDAVALQGKLKTHLPLSTSAATDDPISRTAKTAYEVAEATPLAGSMLNKQRDSAVKALVDKASDDLVPKSLGLNVKLYPGATPAERAANQKAVEQVEQAISQTVDPLRSQRVKVNGEFWSKTVGKRLPIVQRQNFKLYQEIQKTIDEALGPNNPEPDFASVLQAISGLKSLRNSYGGTNNTGEGAIITKVIDSFDQLANMRFNKLGKNYIPVWQKARKLFDEELWGWNNLRRGMTEEGEFTARSLAQGLKGSNTSFDTGKVPGQQLLQLGRRVLVDESPNAPGYFKTMLGLGGVGKTMLGLGGVGGTIAGGAALGGPAGAVMAAGAMPLASTVPVQKALSGQYATQKALAEYLRNNPTALRNLSVPIANTMIPEGN